MINKTFTGFNSTKYVINELVDVGGMSQIYRATSAHNKTVIIKILNYSKTESPKQIKQRLAIEGIISTKLRHPGICRTLDYAQDDEGHFGLVLENLIGKNLNVILKKRTRPFSAKDALFIINEIAGALKYAHTATDNTKNKIVHRDLKPSNIFITEDMRIKLLDFGISTEMDTRLQALKINRGFTKCYTPPDLWIEKNQYDHDAYSEMHDIYCLGLIFYELLTKEKAFKNLQQNISGNIKCLSEHGFKNKELITIFKKWTNPIALQRFQTVDHLLSELSSLEYFEIESNFETVKDVQAEPLETQVILTEADSTYLTLSESKLDSLEELVALNILWRLQKKIEFHEIELKIKTLIQNIAAKTNQTYFNYKNLDIESFSTRTLSVLRPAILQKINPSTIFKNHPTFIDLVKALKAIVNQSGSYSVYSLVYKTLYRCIHPEIVTVLQEIREGLDLDPFVCDEEKNCEGFQESLSALLFLKLNIQQLEVTKSFIQNSVRLDKIPDESFYIYALNFYFNYKKELIEKLTEFEKQIIAYSLSRVAYADKKIDPDEKKYLEVQFTKLKWTSNDFHLLLNQDADNLLLSLPQEHQTLAVILCLDFLIVKYKIDDKEYLVAKNIIEKYIEVAKRTPLKTDSILLLLDFILSRNKEFKTHEKIIPLVAYIKQFIPDFGKTISRLNSIRGLATSYPAKTESEMHSLYAWINEKRSPPVDPLFHLHLYYLFHRMLFLPKNEIELSLVKNHLTLIKKISIEHFSRDFDSILNWKIPYFIFRYIVKCSHYDSNFNEQIHSVEFKRNLFELMLVLKINDQNLSFAKRMIKYNYGERPFLKD